MSKEAQKEGLIERCADPFKSNIIFVHPMRQTHASSFKFTRRKKMVSINTRERLAWANGSPSPYLRLGTRVNA